MDISFIPTDNLYKFMSISGTLMFISGFYAIVYYLLKANNFAYKKDEEMYKDIAKGEYLAWLAKSTGGIDRLSKEAKNLREHSFNSIYKTEHIEKYMCRLQSQFKLVFITSIFVSALGLTIALSGFYLWYVNSQVLQDKESQLKIKELEKSYKQIKFSPVDLWGAQTTRAAYFKTKNI